MCIAVPGIIASIERGVAWISYPGNLKQKALIASMPVKIGDSVMVQMGIIVNILDEIEAESVNKAWNQVTTKLSDQSQIA